MAAMIGSIRRSPAKDLGSRHALRPLRECMEALGQAAVRASGCLLNAVDAGVMQSCRCRSP